MKKTIIAYALPLLFAVNLSEASPVALFEKDYESIAKAVTNGSMMPEFEGQIIEIEALEKSDNVAEFNTHYEVIFNDQEALKLTEKGEVVFTNYAEDKGVATIISTIDLLIDKNEEGVNKELFRVDGIKGQSQIDRENRQYKGAAQFPKMALTNPDPDKKGIISIEGLTVDGTYGFNDDFTKIKTVNSVTKSGSIVVDIDDQKNHAKILADSSSIVSQVDNAGKVQKMLFEIIAPKIFNAESGMPFNELTFDKISYEAGANVGDKGPTIYGDFALKNFILKLANSDHQGLLGDFSLDVQLTGLTEDLFEKLEDLSVSNMNPLEEGSIQEVFNLQEYAVAGSAIQVGLKGDLAGKGTENMVRIVPNTALIEVLTSLDLEDPEALNQQFEGLSFFQFVNQYIDEIDIDLAAKSDYIREMGAHIIFAQGEHTSIESARAEMKEAYQQFMFVAAMINAETPIIEFVGNGIHVNIQYKNNVWYVNGKETDLELIASLFG